VEAVEGDHHRVTAIAETLQKTNLGDWQTGTLVNIERCVAANGRFDGHFVQGHADGTAVCTSVTPRDGSWEYIFSFDRSFASFVVEKGSICINGTSLTVFNVAEDQFTVAIIPYTYEHTNIQLVQAGSRVNIEFDIIGKYIQRQLALQKTI
jgi:riboflavin synthase